MRITGFLTVLACSAAATALDEDPFQFILEDLDRDDAAALPPVTCALQDNFTSYLDKVGKAFNLPGVALAVVRKDIPEVEYFNWGNATEEGDPPSPETLFSIGSCSKAFASISLGILIEEFKNRTNVTSLPPGLSVLEWTSKAKDVLPGLWGLQDEWASEKASLLDLLSHVTGLPRHEYSYDPEESTQTLVSNLRFLRPTYELREKMQYNNLMYSTTAHITSQFSSLPYPSYVHTHILRPLGMSQTTYYPQEAFDSGKLAHNWYEQAGPGFNETRRIPYFLRDWSGRSVEEGFLAGAGGVISSTQDLARWVRTLLNDGKHPDTGAQVIPSSVLETVMTGRSIMAAKGAFPELSPRVYGAGWWRFSYQGHEIVQHGGNVPGSSALVTLLPNDGIGIVVLSNGNGMNDALDALAYRVVEDTFGLKRVDWIDRYLKKSKEELQKKQKKEAALIPSTSLSFSLSDYLGTYASPGYTGNFTLCASSSSPGSDCEAVIKAYAAVDAHFSSSVSTSLYASWPRFWTTHLKLTHLNSSTFALAIDTLHPKGYGRDKTPFFRRMNAGEGSVVEFAWKEGKIVGLGMWGIGAGPRERVPGKPEESSEAWFAKIA